MRLATADIHLTDNPRDDYRFGFQERLRGIVRKFKVEQVLVLGDLTESKDNHSAGLVNRIVDEFHKLSKLCEVLVLRGNHDWLSNANNPFFQFLHHIENIRWIGSPTIIGPDLFLPHTHNHEHDWAGIDLNQPGWIFSHNTFTGAKNEQGREMQGIPISVFPAGARVISGDIHVPQSFGCVTYVGAPYSIDFGDDFEPRVLLIDGDTKKSLKLSGPQKRLLEVDDVDDLAALSTYQKGDIVKIRVKIKPNQYDKWPEFRDTIIAWGKDNGVTVNMVQPMLEAPSEVRRKRPAQNDQELVEQYVKKMNANENTLRAGVWLMKKV